MRYLIVLLLLAGCLQQGPDAPGDQGVGGDAEAPGSQDGPTDGDGQAPQAQDGPPDLEATNPRLEAATWPTADPCPHDHNATVDMTGITAATYNNPDGLSVRLALREANVMGADGTWTDTIALDVTGDTEMTAYMDGAFRTLRIDASPAALDGQRVAMFHQAGMPMPFGVAIADLADSCVPLNGKVLRDDGRWSVTAKGISQNLETFYAYSIGGEYEALPGALLPGPFRSFGVDGDFVPDPASFERGEITLPDVRTPLGWQRLPFEAPWPEPDGMIDHIVPREAYQAWHAHVGEAPGADCMREFHVYAVEGGSSRIDVVGRFGHPDHGRMYEGAFDHAAGTYTFEDTDTVRDWACQPDRSIVGGHAAFWRMLEMPAGAGFSSFGLALEASDDVVFGEWRPATYVMRRDVGGDFPIFATMDARTGLYVAVSDLEGQFAASLA